VKILNKMVFLLISILFVGCGGGGSSDAINQAPKAITQTITLNENQNKQIILNATGTEGNGLVYKIITAPKHGIFKSGIYTPNDNYVGVDSFTFVANDGIIDSSPATVTITITADCDGDNISDLKDTDDDNDGVLDVEDAFPLDATETVDTDGDGIGNNADRDDDNDGMSDTDETAFGSDPIDATSKAVTISGKVTYDLVPVNSNHNGLDYNNIRHESAKNIKVEIVDGSDNVLKTTTTDETGDYTVSLFSNKNVKVRVYAKMIKTGIPSWDVEVVDNTNGDAVYVMEGTLTTSGIHDSVRNLHASASTKTSPPFAILNSVYQAMEKVLSVDDNVIFPTLKINWSVNNVESGTYYDGRETIMLQGDQYGDSDEYDDHIIVHEWGHYFEAKFSRADSIGGQHGKGEALDIRLAFGEGWGNALSGIVTDDPIYFDTYQNDGWSMNVESAPHNNPGWFSEASIQRILYDLYDSNDDGSDVLSLGFKPLYDVLIGAQKVTPAFTSIFSFIKALKDENIDEQGDIDNIVANENIATITDIWGRGRTNRASDYPYYDLTVGSSVRVKTSFDGATNNKLSNHQYVKFTIATAREYTIKVIQKNGTNGDPDFTLYQSTPFKSIGISEGPPNRGVEEKAIFLEEGNYLLDIVDASNFSNVTFKVTISQ